LATPYFVKVLSPEGYGIYALVFGLMGYYQLLDPGLAQGVTKFVAQFNSSDDRESIHRSINAALLFQGVLGALGSLLLVVFADQILGLLNVSGSFYSEAKLGLYLCAGGFLAQILANTFASALKGMQRYDLTAKVDAGVSLIFNLVGIVLLYIGYGLTGLIVLKVVTILLTLLIFAYTIRRDLGGLGFSYGVSRSDYQNLFNFSGFLFISQLSTVFTNYAVRFVISFYLGPAAVTFYEVPKKVLKALGGFLSSASVVLFPYASELNQKREHGRIRSIYVQSSRAFAAFSMPAFLLVLVFSKHILTIWMGKGFAEESWPVLSVMAGTVLLGSLTTVPNNIALGLGYTRLKSIFSIISIVLYLILLPVLTKQLGVMGTAIGVFCSTVFTGMLFVLYFTRGVLKIELRTYLKKTFSIHLIPIAASFLLLLWIPRVSTSWIVVMGGVVAGLVYWVLIIGTGWIRIRRVWDNLGFGQLIGIKTRES
jgi:O-antigen/teichoic acid export membrane protein